MSFDKEAFYEKYFHKVKGMCKDVISHFDISDEWLRKHIVFSETFSGSWCLSTYSFRNVLISSTKDPKVIEQFNAMSPRNLLREYYVDIFPNMPFHKRERLVEIALEEIKKRG